MTMQQVPRDQALMKTEFHKRLGQWFHQTAERTVGPGEADGRTRWIHVRSGTTLFALHADTPRDAVEWYLGIVAAHGDHLEWEPAPSQRGNMTAVVYGPQQLRNTSFYLYVAGTVG